MNRPTRAKFIIVSLVVLSVLPASAAFVVY